MRRFAALLLLLACAGCASGALPGAGPLTTVGRVDVPRFLGRWYEVARYPMFFERNCARDATATYAPPGADGTIGIVNRCVTGDGGTQQATGTARIAEPATNAKLKVRFGFPVDADYWVVALDPQYRWAVIGEPQRRFLWLLARDAHPSPAAYAALVARAHAAGYDTARLERTPQT